MSTSQDLLQTRKDAWARLPDDLSALNTLYTTGPGDLIRTEKSQTRSNHARLLSLAETLSAETDLTSRRYFELSLNLLVEAVAGDGAITRATIPRLTRMIVVSRIRTGEPGRTLPYPLELARPVLRTLVDLSTELIDGRVAFPVTQTLAEPYLSQLDPSDPLVQIFTSTTTPPPPTDSTPSNLVVLSGALEGDQPFRTTPTDLLALIAPQLLTSLQTAPSPPFGIPSTYIPSRLESGAGSFAGKVYSQHEFRNRESVMPSGLGAGRGVSRPASRHVDDWAR